MPKIHVAKFLIFVVFMSDTIHYRELLIKYIDLPDYKVLSLDEYIGYIFFFLISKSLIIVVLDGT